MPGMRSHTHQFRPQATVHVPSSRTITSAAISLSEDSRRSAPVSGSVLVSRSTLSRSTSVSPTGTADLSALLPAFLTPGVAGQGVLRGKGAVCWRFTLDDDRRLGQNVTLCGQGGRLVTATPPAFDSQPRVASVTLGARSFVRDQTSHRNRHSGRPL